jgi:steroid delta-isomerase-like uncharacterized protein
MEDEIFNKRRLDAVDEFIAPDYILRTAAQGMPNGRDLARDAIAAYLAAFPDLNIEVEELVAEDDRVVGCFRFTGTHQGDLFGIAPSGARIYVRQIAIYRIREGQIVDEWEVSDQLGLMQQVGAMPA